MSSNTGLPVWHFLKFLNLEPIPENPHNIFFFYLMTLIAESKEFSFRISCINSKFLKNKNAKLANLV